MRKLIHCAAASLLFLHLMNATQLSQLNAAMPQDSSKNESESRKTDDNETMTVKLLDERIIDRGRGMTQVFVLADEDQIHNEGKAAKIVKPLDVDEADWAWTKVYFTGRAGIVEKGIVVLIGDYRSESPKFFIDQNNNLDFSDDPRTNAAQCEDGGTILEFLGDKEESRFAIKLLPFRDDESLTDEKKKQYGQMFEGYRSYVGGDFTDVDYWYFNQRLNTRTKSVDVDGQKVMLGLHDYDCDGLYSGERDRLLVGKHGGESISYALADGAVNTVPGEVFLIGDSPYKLIEASDDGSQIRIAKSSTMPSRMFVGTQVPNLKLKSFDGEAVSLKSLIHPEKLLVLDFWGHWCGPCISAFPKCVEFQDKWKDKVTFVGVHNGDQDAARKVLEEKDVAWVQYEFSNELEETFFIDAWPTYVVIDGDGKLISFRSSLKEIAELLNK